MQAHVPGNLMIGTHSGSQHKPYLPLFQNIARAIAHARLRSAIASQRHPKCRPVIMSRLPRIADIKLDVIHSFQGEKVRIGYWLGHFC